MVEAIVWLVVWFMVWTFVPWLSWVAGFSVGAEAAGAFDLAVAGAFFVIAGGSWGFSLVMIILQIVSIVQLVVGA
jgi:hypothetical protein